ncbi:hypothetical protein, partial [Collinsella aerofaciens]|uniref:hypothetical protein n=1 Tax=Collinsella aerofaciens TaxID=74426 RepID=UPI001C9D7222
RAPAGHPGRGRLGVGSLAGTSWPHALPEQDLDHPTGTDEATGRPEGASHGAPARPRASVGLAAGRIVPDVPS